MQQQLRAHLEKIVALTDEEFDVVLAHVRERRYKKREFLIQEDQMVSDAYFVVSGLLKLVYTDDSGRQHILSFAMEDWWESDFRAFYTQTAATLSLQCVEDTAVFCLSLESYHALCADLPKLQRFFLQKATFGSIAAQQRIFSLLTTNIQERYDQLLQQYPALVQRLSKTMLASYLGVSRETLSRLS
ncbi:Crp/Fnr family transcriptional regulator [Hymenobacter sediminis]|uniref:Crp/Fnr family transcriptional regulator n=1 Tax=Hymenobacter sediminis TaxID=2218621 RepID=UPI000DA6B9A0|nr:Crp/Fnr family transcriptional regulator [Hymenobacter sediminis]RPD45729.1 Crp/Fnr family transcriptional regulator [Hymenobacter sediminis]